MAKIRSELEQQMAALVNLERNKYGLSQLSFNTHLSIVGRKHSLEQLHANNIYHESPLTGSPADRLQKKNISFIACGENLAMGDKMKVLHQKLMLSPSHKANILHLDFDTIGIGIYQTSKGRLFITQVFTKKIPSVSIPYLLGDFSLNVDSLRQQYRLPKIKTFQLNVLSHFNKIHRNTTFSQNLYNSYCDKMLEELSKFGIQASHVEVSYGEAYDFKKVINDSVQKITQKNLKAICISIDKADMSKLIISIGFVS
jgi:hypothetical protein